MAASDRTIPHASVADGQSPTHVRYVVMAFLCALSFLTYFDRVCIMQAQHDIQHDLLLTDRQMGWILGAFWFAYALFEIPSGWLGDRFGTRGTLTRIVIAWSLFTGLSGAATGFFMLLAFRFLFGAGEAGAYPSMARIQQSWLPVRSRGRAGGILWLLARWGGAFSPLIFTGILGLFSSERFRGAMAHIQWLHPLAGLSPWRFGFFVSGLVGVVWVVLFRRWFREQPAEKSSVNLAELALICADRPPGEAEASHRIGRELWRDLLASRSLWALATLYLCGSFGWNFFVSWMPRFLLDVHHVKFSVSPRMSWMPLFFGGISCLAGGWLSDVLVRRTGSRRWGRAVFPIAGCLTAAIAIFCMRFAHSPGQAIALMCVTAAAYDFGQGANWAAIIDIGGVFAGTATGFINMIGNLGNSLQAPIGARLVEHQSWGPLFTVYAVAYLVAGSMWFIVDPRKPFYSERP
jgi:MFS family permease